MNYYAMLATQTVVHIPNASTFDEAAENEPGDTVWIFNEEGLRELIANAQDAIKEANHV